MARLVVLHQISRLHRSSFRDAARDQVGHHVARLHQSKDELRDLADPRHRIQVRLAQRADPKMANSDAMAMPNNVAHGEMPSAPKAT